MTTTLDDSMKKLIIQIPCWNEELNIAKTLQLIPKKFEGIDSVELLIIDDGSTDQTVEIARKAGVDHIVKLPKHMGLARAFETGIQKCLSLGADIIVNTDADNQYEATDIRKLIRPILEDDADLVVGDRLSSKLPFLTRGKRLLYFCADWIVSLLMGAHSPDPTSGFRALKSQFARSINLRDNHSYTLETLVQAYFLNCKVTFIPIKSRLVNRPSRLIRSTPIYIYKTTLSLIRSIIVYGLKPEPSALILPKPSTP